jgi:hypothetical protein
LILRYNTIIQHGTWLHEESCLILMDSCVN